MGCRVVRAHAHMGCRVGTRPMRTYGLQGGTGWQRRQTLCWATTFAGIQCLRAAARTVHALPAWAAGLCGMAASMHPQGAAPPWRSSAPSLAACTALHRSTGRCKDGWCCICIYPVVCAAVDCSNQIKKIQHQHPSVISLWAEVCSGCIFVLCILIVRLLNCVHP